MPNNIICLPKWTRGVILKYPGYQVIDTISNSGDFRELSPFVLGPIDTYIPGKISRNFENLWQYSKVYQQHVDYAGVILPEWYKWRDVGWMRMTIKHLV